jgi:hypothetical protein
MRWLTQSETPSSGKEPFSGPSLVSRSESPRTEPARGYVLRQSFRHWQFELPTTRPRLLASAATETRFLSQTPLTRFCNLVNAKTDTPTSDSTSHETIAFAHPVCSTRLSPNRTVSSTAPKPILFRDELRLAPRRCLPYRSRSSEPAFSVLRRERPTLTIPRTPVVADSSLVEPEVDPSSRCETSRDSHFRRPRERVRRS